MEIDTPPASLPKASATDGNSDARPTPLYHGFHLRPGSAISVTSRAPIEVAPGISVSSASPVLISTNNISATISSSLPLNRRVARGWNRLPKWLRVEILSYLVPIESTTIDTRFYDFEKNLKPYVQMPVEIRRLALEMFFGRNSFRTTPFRNYIRECAEDWQLGRPILHLVRKVDLYLKMGKADWEKLRKISEGQKEHWSFQHLVFIKLSISWNSGIFKKMMVKSWSGEAATIDYCRERFAGFVRGLVGEGISFRCNGCVEFSSETDEDVQARERIPKGLAVEFETRLRELVTFGPTA